MINSSLPFSFSTNNAFKLLISSSVHSKTLMVQFISQSIKKSLGGKMGSIRCSKLAKYLILTVVIMACSAVTSESFESGRHLLQTESAADPGRQSDDTVRVDPLDNLKKYRGGYDITNKHYWSSTVFTGIYGYSLAVLWLICGLGYGGYVVITNSCYKNNERKLKKKRSPCHLHCYLWPALVAVFFTFLAIVASALVLRGNAKLHSRAKNVVDILIDTADDASDTIYETTGAMKDMSTSLATTDVGGEATNFLTSTSKKLDSQAADIHRQARKNRRAIDKGLKIVYIITAVTMSLNLVAAISLSVFGVLKFQRTFHWLIVLCWILTVLCWLFFGVYFFIANFAGDTCTAIEGFQKNPYNNSLSSILPCDELISAKSVLHDISVEIHDIVNEVNSNISTNFGNIVQICNPFSAAPQYEYQPNNCPEDTIKIGDIPELLKLLTCPDSKPCTGGLSIPARDYNMVEAYTTSIQRLLTVYPGMESLVKCQTVSDAFSEILNKHCKPLKRYTRMVWASMVFLSVVMVALVLIWTIEARHEQSHHSLEASVKPYSAAADMLELGTAKESSNKPISSSVL